MYRAAAAAAMAISRSSSSVVRSSLARGGVYGGAERRRWARRFAAKEVNFGFEARAAILQGTNDPADAIKNMESDSSADNVGASLVKQVADATRNSGTTCGSAPIQGYKATSVITSYLKCNAWMMESTAEINQKCRLLPIFAEDADGEPLSMIVLNDACAKICSVRVLGFREINSVNWNRMAVSTGGKLACRLFCTDSKVKIDNRGGKGQQEEYTFFEMLKLAIKSLLSKVKSLLDGEITELQRVCFLALSVLSAIQYGCYTLETADAHHSRKVDARFTDEELKLETWRNERELILVNRKRDAALFAAEEAEVRCQESVKHAENLEKDLAKLGRQISYLSKEVIELRWLHMVMGESKD
ncbi:hypothetical protein ZWY2020_043821 [Hordeum vulgare]|nr:hypothetical protein ZWY2020_043821 [Hordeum vulgare]